MENNLNKIRYSLELAKELLEKGDPLDDKIKAKLKGEMDKRKFSEADATRHVVDRDRGNTAPKPPKPLLQTESISSEGDFRTDPPPVHDGKKNIYFNKSGQWTFNKDDSVKPFGQSVYNSTANLNRKATRTGEVREDAGRNQAVRNYTTSGSSVSAAHEAAEQKAHSKNPAPVKTLADMSPEEKKALETKYNTKLKKAMDDLEKGAGWSYNGATGNFNHPLYGSVKIRQKDGDKGFDVVHNAKVISNHGPEDKAAAIGSAASHMKSLSTTSGSHIVTKGGLGQADENTVLKEEVSENADRFGCGED